MKSQLLPEIFFHLPTLDLAKALLGTILVHETMEGTTSGIIVETEAYIGPEDKAAHSYGGIPTERTRVMFGPPGFAYVYQIYGMHYCFNVVSGEETAPEAILIRALEPVVGIPLMIRRRGLDIRQLPDGSWPTNKLKLLTNGPGKLAQAMGISKDQYGLGLKDSSLRILPRRNKLSADQIRSGPRIGIEYAEEAREYPWRYWIAGNPYVSKPR
ncbi:DNA-3-methyladenine glycosylase [Effusibacillus lacus]|uniref:Putative 3-methyladenine DNA glycosylase n=1 Tax=Effusibacillus lacus TaxID=1348429 RepID=A0A292YRY3_9BACL|nr:DNA-3-methyladenine glycosylase [Effusibacillus lacus]TCS76889.1 DNA-3-methyladenine glycosylase [Effusibacillus lacus]GAX91220.1 DNA-3-methyladenine glycosylase [Effusibacillus lacus]